MTLKQIERAYRNLWERCTRHDGYQMFGYDMRTIRLSNPGFAAGIDRLKAMYRDAEDADYALQMR